MKKVLSFLIGMFLFLSKAYTKGNDSVVFFVKNTYLVTGKADAQISVSWNTYFPLVSFGKTIVKLSRTANDEIYKIKSPGPRIRIDYTDFIIETGDTIYTVVEDEKKTVTFTYANNPNFFYLQYRNKHFLKNNSSPISLLYNDSIPFDYDTYKKYCYDYYAKEQNLVDSFFGSKRVRSRNLMLLESQNSLLSALLQPALAGKVISEEQISKLKASVVEKLSQLNKFPRGDFPYNYRSLLAYVNLFLTGNILTNQYISANNYARLQRNASKIFSRQVYLNYLMNELSTISRIGNESYKKVAREMYGELEKSNLPLTYKKQIRTIYRNFLVLTLNIKSFAEVKVKNVEGKVLRLRDIIQNNTPTMIDFWASWCKPCIEEFPYLDSVQQHLSGFNFITLSIDEDENKWLNFLKKHERLNNSSYLLLNYKQSRIIRDYNISQIPRFIVFDKNGDCLSGDFIAPSMSNFSNQLIELINSRNRF